MLQIFNIFCISSSSNPKFNCEFTYNILDIIILVSSTVFCTDVDVGGNGNNIDGDGDDGDDGEGGDDGGGGDDGEGIDDGNVNGNGNDLDDGIDNDGDDGELFVSIKILRARFISFEDIRNAFIIAKCSNPIDSRYFTLSLIVIFDSSVNKGDDDNDDGDGNDGNDGNDDNDLLTYKTNQL